MRLLILKNGKKHEDGIQTIHHYHQIVCTMVKSFNSIIQAHSHSHPSVSNTTDYTIRLSPLSQSSAPEPSATTLITLCTTTGNGTGVKALLTLLIANPDNIYIMSSLPVRTPFAITVKVYFTVYMNLLFPSVHPFPNWEGSHILLILKTPIHRQNPFPFFNPIKYSRRS